MTYYLIKRTIFLAILLSSLLCSISIKGNIVNSENNEVLIGANVYIKETSTTDEQERKDSISLPHQAMVSESCECPPLLNNNSARHI